MRLHEDQEAFDELIEATSAEFNYEKFQIEKDYYVSLVLKEISKLSSDIIFKGGTSLSKCYEVIHRFSEDIDLGLSMMKPVTNSEKQKLKYSIECAVEKLGFEIINDKLNPPIQLRTRGNFNEYHVSYKKRHSGEISMLEQIVIETNVSMKLFPFDYCPVNNLITKFLLQEQEAQLISFYDLHPFEMKVQSIDRTFIDKIFAICDYFELGKTHRYSRHLYDIHMIWKSEHLNKNNLGSLFNEVAMIRRESKNRDVISSQLSYPISSKLQEIVGTNFYKVDYETNTKEFLSKYVSYMTVINTLNEIKDYGFIPEVIY